MATTTKSSTIVIIDDEIYNMIWMIDYFESLGYSVITKSDANNAVSVLSDEIYRAAIIDLNIPAHHPILELISSKGDVYRKYPGLYVAFIARNKGYRGKQIVIYSVHKDLEVAEEARKLGCTYILKGRPKEIKQELQDIISFDPTTSN